ncbi:hypothetical protein TRFO_02653 [Tritrichomonas foetus]|uniref:Uncharacterized protein n=1 Tax=Tritrichomonas foetus TaxID=1144522 RepID=A0A1J4KZ28_9EUKA|nr:hypothetical protein TRFO_02653 [Tritrichomonas foetus]|eukprot:OHT16410.1 hypothetical protein TRFO_02653 [Tritrichomonas foetus]
MEATFNVQIVGDRTPGPAPCDHVDRDRFGDGLKYSIRSRFPIPSYTNDPYLVNLPTTVGNVPKINMHGRCDPPNPFVPPGPNYVPPAFGKDAHSIRFKKDRKREKKKPGPGPADYTISRTAGKMVGTESPRTNIRTGGPRQLWGTIESPGPAVYKPRHDSTRASSPRWTIGNRYKERRKDRTGEYIPPKSTLDKHGFSFGRGGRTPIFHI